MATANNEGIQINTNRIQEEVKEAPGKVISDKDFAKLMKKVNMGKVGKKNANFKEFNKAN